MKRSSTPTVLTAIPLLVTPKQVKILNVRIDIKRQIKNACIGEFRKRLKRLRSHPDFQKAILMPKGEERTKTFKEVEEKTGFTLNAMNRFTTEYTQSWMHQHIDSVLAQRIGEEVWKSYEEYRFKGKGKPRFKSKRQASSVEGKSNTGSIMWKNENKDYFDAPILPTTGYYVKWNGLKLPAIIDPKDEVVCWGLTLKVKYSRIVRKVIHGKDRFYVQLIQQGVPYRKPQHTIGKGKVGIDLGPSSVAIVGERKAMLLEFCPGVVKDAKKTRKLQRRTDRQRRANNPDNYNPNGTIKEGPKKWNISKRQKRVEAQLKETDRVLAAHRDSEHGALANKVLTMGDDIRHEKVSIKAWQKRYGRSIVRKAPGSFQSKVDRKAESAGGKISEVSTYKTDRKSTRLNS